MKRSNLWLAMLCAGILIPTVAVRANRLNPGDARASGKPKATIAELLRRAGETKALAKTPVKTRTAQHRSGRFILTAADTTPPVPAIVFPVHGTYHTLADYNANGIHGSATDDAGVDHFVAALYRYHYVDGGNQDVAYWDGTAWSTDVAYAPLTTDGLGTTSATWRVTSPPAGADLPDFLYTIDVQAYDAAGNQSSTSATYGLLPPDTTKPAGSFTVPSGDSVSASDFVSFGFGGFATDNASVASVTYSLGRHTAGADEYWDGTAWGATKTPLSPATTGGSPNIFWYISPLPAVESLTAGSYFCELTVTDGAGNQDVSTKNFTIFVPDTVPPSAAIQTPVHGTYNTFADFTANGIHGSASDNVAVDHYVGTLYRYHYVGGNWQDTQTWDGTAWVNSVENVQLDTTGLGTTNSTWSVNPLPAGADLDASYLCEFDLSAVDAAGNSTTASSTFGLIAPDTTKPAGSFTVPSGDSVTSADFVNFGFGGYATDNVSVASVTYSLGRVNATSGDNEYWDGEHFVATKTPLAAQLVGGDPNYFWLIDKLPSVEALTAGSYFCELTVTDSSGNQDVTTKNFTITIADNSIPLGEIETFDDDNIFSVAEFAANGLHGTATDNVAVDHLAAVLYRLKYDSDGLQTDVASWNGTAWVTTGDMVPLTTTGLGTKNVTWSVTTLPSGADLDTSFLYQFGVRFTDTSNNESVASLNFQFDTTKPTGSFTVPSTDSLTAHEVVNYGIGGYASDDTSVASVTYSLGRYNTTLAANQYWDGTAWGSTKTPLPAELVGTDPDYFWLIDKLPAESDLASGNYFCELTVTDGAGNQVVTTKNFAVDERPTVTAITSPLSAHYSSDAFPAITATAVDDNAVVRGECAIFSRRGGDPEYWNGTSWGHSQVWLPMTAGTSGPGASTTLTYEGAKPTDADLTGDDCTVFVRAVDSVNFGDEKFQVIAIDKVHTGDTTAPTTAVNSPAIGTFVSPNDFVAGGISGTATDNVGVTNITAGLFRFSLFAPTGEYWNGTSWVTASFTDPILPLNITTTGMGTPSATWSITNGPAASDMAPGYFYSVNVMASDAAGNEAIPNSQAFFIENPDTTAPTPVINTPAANAVIKPNVFAASTVAGTANDDTEVDSITVRLVRDDHGTLTYWDGSAFQSTAADAAITTGGLATTDAIWSLNGIPSAAQLGSAHYTLQVTATDAAGNSGVAERNFVVTTDAKRPVTTMTTPAAAAKITIDNFALGGTVTGTVTEETSLWGVHIYLSRVRAGVTQYWTGSGWGTTKTAVDAAVTGNAWTWTNNLPAASDLDAGAYRLEAAGYDVAGDGTAATRAFTLIGETNAPQAIIASPGASVKLQAAAFAASSVNGSVTDDTEVKTVSVKLYRVISGVKTFWDGTAWASVTATVPVNLSTVDPKSVTWSIQTLPAAGTLTAGSYGVQVVATDVYGNSVTATRPFSIVNESVKPIVTIASPTASTTIDASKLTSSSFRGTATDNVQVASVTAKLYRTRGGVKEYYDGTAWSTASATAPVVSTGLGTASVAWQIKPLPAKAVFDTGVYGLLIQATDSSGNVGSATTSFNVFADNTAPVATITAPASNGTVQASAFDANTITGTATDNIQVSDIRVKLTRTRGSIKEYWTGTAWTTTATNAQISSTGLNTASATWSLAPAPTVSDLDAGLYSVSVTPVDPSGNVGTPVTRNFTVALPVAALKYSSPSGKGF